MAAEDAPSKPPRAGSPDGKSSSDPREDRLAKALRDNLRRRKAPSVAGEGAPGPEKPR